MSMKGTTICAVKKDGKIAIAGDGQVTMGEHTIFKGTAKKVRRIYNDTVVTGFAGTVADAFSLCERLEEKLIDAVYYVDHLDEFNAQYEVVGLTGASSAITCPYCGAQTQNHQVCEYCGSKLSEDSGKIKVASASDIPNPIMQAQDIIFERYETVIKQYTAANKTDDDGILDNISMF